MLRKLLAEVGQEGDMGPLLPEDQDELVANILHPIHDGFILHHGFAVSFVSSGERGGLAGSWRRYRPEPNHLEPNQLKCSQ